MTDDREDRLEKLARRAGYTLWKDPKRPPSERYQLATPQNMVKLTPWGQTDTRSRRPMGGWRMSLDDVERWLTGEVSGGE